MKYDVHINPPKLSSEDIQKHQDFDALFAQFEQAAASAESAPASEPSATTTIAHTARKTPFKLYYAWGGMAVAASVALFMIVRNVGESGGETLTYPAPIALVAPVAKLDKAFMTFTVDAAQGDTVLNYNSGSVIKVPADAFVDKNGNPIAGKIDIQYRELNNHVEQFAAGVPQQPTVAQNVSTIQIQGYQNGEPIYVNQGKKLDIELRTPLPTEVAPSDLKIYAYEQKTDSWKFQQVDNVEIITNATTNTTAQTTNPNSASSKESEAQLASIRAKYPLPAEPVKMAKPADNRETFDIDFDKKEFPELSQYHGVMWAINGTDTKYQNALTSRDWSNMSLKHKQGNRYELFLADEKGDLRIEVVPVLSNAAEAERVYKEQLAAYQKDKTAIEAKIQTEWNAWLASNGKTTVPTTEPTEQLVIHRFQIAQFGLWACANEQAINPNSEAIFADANGKSIDLQRIYVADPTSKLYYSTEVAAQAATPFYYKQSMQVWAMDAQNQIYVAEPIAPTANAVKFRLTLLRAQTEQDLYNAIAFHKHTQPLNESIN